MLSKSSRRRSLIPAGVCDGKYACPYAQTLLSWYTMKREKMVINKSITQYCLCGVLSFHFITHLVLEYDSTFRVVIPGMNPCVCGEENGPFIEAMKDDLQ